MRNMNYSWAVTLLKGLVAGSGTTGVSAVLLWILDGVNTGDWSMKPETQGIVISLLTGAAAALWTMFKNYAKQKWGWVLPVLVCAVALQGCATLAPAVGGKTEIETTFSDVVGPDGTQNTQYSQKLKAPAGVEAADLASMSYQWQEDGSGAIAVSSAPNANTLEQSNLLQKSFEADDRRFDMLLQTILGLGNLASPLVGQKIQSDSLNQAAGLANKAALQSMIAEIVKQVIAQQVAPPKPADTDMPLIDLPTVGATR